MSKNQYTLLVFSIIGILLLAPGYGVHFFEQIWNFPGNLFSDDFKKSFPLATIPLNGYFSFRNWYVYDF